MEAGCGWANRGNLIGYELIIAEARGWTLARSSESRSCFLPSKPCRTGLRLKVFLEQDPHGLNSGSITYYLFDLGNVS